MIACSKKETMVQVSSTSVEGDFKDYLSVVDKEFVIKPNEEGDEFSFSLKLKVTKKCEACRYEDIRVQLLDEGKAELANIRYFEGLNALSIDENLNQGSGEFTLKFEGNLLNGVDNEEAVSDILEKVKFAKVTAKASEMPSKGELMLGTSAHGGIIVIIDEKGEHGLVMSKKDIGTEADWNMAKQLCEADSSGGFNDWRLPTNEEFKSIYSNLRLNSKIPSESELQSAYYWTSTVYNQNFGTTWPYSFDYSRGESTHNFGMVNKFNVRAVRAF